MVRDYNFIVVSPRGTTTFIMSIFLPSSIEYHSNAMKEKLSLFHQKKRSWQYSTFGYNVSWNYPKSRPKCIEFLNSPLYVSLISFTSIVINFDEWTGITLHADNYNSLDFLPSPPQQTYIEWEFNRVALDAQFPTPDW